MGLAGSASDVADRLGLAIEDAEERIQDASEQARMSANPTVKIINYGENEIVLRVPGGVNKKAAKKRADIFVLRMFHQELKDDLQYVTTDEIDLGYNVSYRKI